MYFGPIENEQKLIFLHISTYISLQFLLKNHLILTLVIHAIIKSDYY